MAGASGDQKFNSIAQQRAVQFKKNRQDFNIGRARSQDGQPVLYQKVKDKANITRHSRVMSDPDIPSTLVILNAKGLFQGKNGARSKPEIRPASLDIMDKETTRPAFFDPSINEKETKVSDLKKQFEAVECDIAKRSVLNSGGNFLNPLHKVNQGLASSERNKTGKTKQPTFERDFQDEAVEHDTLGHKRVSESDTLHPLNKVNQDLALITDNKSKKNVQKKFEKVLSAPDASMKKPIPPPKVHLNKVINETVSAQAVKESAGRKPPSRPPPRAPKRDPLKRCRGESDPLPLDENRVSRVLHVPQQESLEGIVQEEEIAINYETEECVTVSSYDENYIYDDVVDNDDGDDDDDDDEWDTDFGDDDDEDDDEERLKRESQSSHGSSCDAEPLEFPDAVSKKLYNIASEILTTERAYVRRLHLLDQVFYLRLNNECCAKGVLPMEALNDIFSNIQAIHQLHRDFLLPKLEARMKEWSTNNQIGDILKGLAPFLKMYTLYVGNFDKATESLSTWMKKSPAITAVIDEIQKSKECKNLTLQHHMLEPVQRVPRYQLLLKDYLSKLPEDSKDLKNTSDALEIISESARHANDSMKKTERFKILLEIQERIGVDYPLITASRELVMEGEFTKVAARTSDSHQERTLMLFNDVLLCCAKFPGTNKYKVKVEMDLYGMEVETVEEDLEMEDAFRITSKQRVMDFTAPTAEAKETFVNKLKETINELRSKRDSYNRASKIEVMKEGDLGKKAPAWIRDEAVSMCMLCDVMFTKLRRRHHCRACGRVVCGNCSSFKAALEYKNGKLEKVCKDCHRVLVKGSSDESAKEAKPKGSSILKIDSDSKIWHNGYLSFKMKGDKGWQKRWFVLSSDFVLYRYKAKKDTKAEFNLPLPGHNVDKPSLADEVDRKNVFKVHHKNVRVYLFQAESEESMNRWMELLAHATKAEQIEEDQLQGKNKSQRADSAS